MEKIHRFKRVRNGRTEYVVTNKSKNQFKKTLSLFTTIHETKEFSKSHLIKALEYEISKKDQGTEYAECFENACRLSAWKDNDNCYLHHQLEVKGVEEICDPKGKTNSRTNEQNGRKIQRILEYFKALRTSY